MIFITSILNEYKHKKPQLTFGLLVSQLGLPSIGRYRSGHTIDILINKKNKIKIIICLRG